MKREFHLIAHRSLLFSEVGNSEKKSLDVKVGLPYEIKSGEVSFTFSKGTAGCDLYLEGLSNEPTTSYGADTVQALEIALQFDKTLLRLSSKYSFYFANGEPYFES